MTKFVKKEEINSKWYEIDAKNAVVGRLATIITKILRGKNTAKYSPPCKAIVSGFFDLLIFTPFSCFFIYLGYKIKFNYPFKTI